MAFASSFRRVLNGCSSGSSILPSQFASIRLNSTTLTSPKLFISGLSRLTTDEKLKEAFSPFGQLIEAKTIVDRMSGRPKGFGFVTYSTIEEAEKAREKMNATYLDGWVIFIDPAKPKERRPPSQPAAASSEAGSNFRTNKTAGSNFRTNKTVGWRG